MKRQPGRLALSKQRGDYVCDVQWAKMFILCVAKLKLVHVSGCVCQSAGIIQARLINNFACGWSCVNALE